ncbi:disease resistance protein RPP2A-like [Eucalyptus grandis]|uniref:disease resistance protein RPP2A-like n=1 Tax=Eucalyptus grandis TaxID=71139 RepID=UPI00192EA437|nr:disease resistance protein RPP2A-like [Eucalyptus grandis]
MDRDKALELFSLHAFNGVSPPNAYRSLSQEVVFMTGGLPLALEVIGSYLHDQTEEIWKEMLEMLKKVPHDEVRDKLKISYDALGDVEKEVFLDIACFFISGKKLWAAYFWDACHLYPHKSLKKLTDLCLIKIVDGDTIWMHDQLRDLGRDIVKKECALSRLWNDKEALEVMRSKERKDKIKALNLGQYNSDPIALWMKNLRGCQI